MEYTMFMVEAVAAVFVTLMMGVLIVTVGGVIHLTATTIRDWLRSS